MDYGRSSDVDNFFFSGEVDIDTQITSEVLQSLMQPKRSMFFNRSFGAGIPDYENKPLTAQLQIGMAYDIITGIARRNQEVPNGSDGTTDYRAVASQSGVVVEADGDTLGVSVWVIPLHSLQSRKIPAIPISGNLR